MLEGDLSSGELSACEGGCGAAVDEDGAVGQRGDGEGDTSGVIVCIGDVEIRCGDCVGVAFCDGGGEIAGDDGSVIDGSNRR